MTAFWSWLVCAMWPLSAIAAVLVVSWQEGRRIAASTESRKGDNRSLSADFKRKEA